MQNRFSSKALDAFCLLLLPFTLSSEALAQRTPNQRLTQGDLSSFRSIAEDTLATLNKGNLKRAKSRIKDLETDWDRAEATLRPRNPEQWRTIDKAIDFALLQLRANSPQAPAAKEALKNLLGELDQPDKSAAAAPGKAEAVASGRLSLIDIIAALERLRTDESVLDVSFEPKDGQPIYAVRTYANGKVWDGLLDGLTGAVVGDGTVTDESELDDEDKAEVAASSRAKIALRQAIEIAENTGNGRALNAGLEQVRGRVVWEILLQNPKHQQIRIDPITGRIL
ncbi:MAG TPA: PepSY domain-containing protein [Bradyrhizobium sp.]